MQLELQKFNRAPATHIVSLGKGCATAHNLRRHFDFGTAFPFDWWMSTKLDGLNLFLASPEVDAVYDPSRLQLTPGADSICHQDFGFLLHHEFPRRWDLPNKPIREDWREYIDKPKSRTKALLSKWLRLNAPDYRIAFVREGDTNETLVEYLQKLFPAPEWTLIGLQNMQNPARGWRGDPAAWNTALIDSGLVLDRKDHLPYVEKSSEPDVDSRTKL